MISQPPAGPPGTTEQPALSIDALGRKCPLPIIMLAERIGEVAVGQVVQVLADDPAAKTDVPAWCGLKSHDFVGIADLPGDIGWAFHIRRSY
ncbi:MAG: sulfurtransferase TusA family protein [Nocardiopsaceae bacterium]|nr:sulfurtransferase TusA family protein [Nocardiopsaceae bacterium]